jgi:hypothetical protein
MRSDPKGPTVLFAWLPRWRWRRARGLGVTAPTLLLCAEPTTIWLHDPWLKVHVARDELCLPAGTVANR